MRKIIVVLLAVILMATACPVWAAEAEDAAAELGKYGIMNGDPDGNLRLADTVSRAEFAKMIMAAKDGRVYAPTKTVFTDVNSEHWAAGYIMKAVEYGILNGMGDGTFAPETTVTGEQALKMVLCALGYSGPSEEKGGYPTGYYAVAEELGLWNRNTSDGTLPASRATVAILLEKALDIPLREEKKIYFFNDSGRLDVQLEITVHDGTNGASLLTFRTGLR